MKRLLLASLVLALLGGGYWYFWGRSSAPAATVVVTGVGTVSTGSISQSVKALGRVTVQRQVTLTFRQAAVKVNKVYVGAGQKVKKNQLLAELDKSDWKSSYSQQSLSVKSAQVSFDKLTASPKVSALVQARTSVANAERSVATAASELALAKDSTARGAESSALDYAALADSAKSAAGAASRDIADVLQDAGEFLSITREQPWKYVLGGKDSLTVPRVTDAYSALSDALVSLDAAVAKAAVSGWPASRQDVADLAQATRDASTAHSAFSSAAVKVLYATVPGSGIDQSTYDSYLSTFQSNASKADSRFTSSVNLVTQVASAADSAYAGASAASTIQQKEAALASAKSSLVQAQASLDDLLAGATAEERQSSLLSISQAKAKLADTSRSLSDYEMRAPFDGVIAAVGVSEGQIQGQNSNSDAEGITVWDPTSARVRLKVDQSDAVRMKLGQSAVVTVDAYPGLSFSGKVSEVNTAPIEESGVVSYYAFVTLDAAPTLLDGMTATVEVKTGARDNVVMVPSAAVFTENGKTYVTVVGDASLGQEKREVSVTGANRGLSEVLSGLSVGEKVQLRSTSSAAARKSLFAPGSRTGSTRNAPPSGM